ncbi:MAG: hypothetical protein B6I38_10105, partial [Anaerolineaceae bacterium 4572_5.1]
SRTVVISDGELVNETIAQALPLLSHPLMQEMAHRVERIHFQPGETIIHAKEPVDTFFLIASGKVDVVLRKRRRDDVVISQITKNDYFGEVELLRSHKSIASVRASIDGPVELLALPREDFNWLMGESPLTKDAISKTVQKRLEENRQADRRKKRFFRRSKA